MQREKLLCGLTESVLWLVVCRFFLCLYWKRFLNIGFQTAREGLTP